MQTPGFPSLSICICLPLAITAALSTALRNFKKPYRSHWNTLKGAGDYSGGTFDRIRRGLWDLVDYGKPLLFAGAPLPLVLFVTRKDQGSCSNERK